MSFMATSVALQRPQRPDDDRQRLLVCGQAAGLRGQCVSAGRYSVTILGKRKDYRG